MIAAIALVRALVATDVPVDPDRDQAQRWLLEELSKPEYRAAEPTWFDRLSAAFWDWLNSLDVSGGGIPQEPLVAILVAVVVAVLIVAFLVFGVPRLNRKASAVGALFGDDEMRNARDLRRSAEAAAAAGDWTSAIEELFRSIARMLTERTIVTTTPGTTAREFAARTGVAFPDLANATMAAAQVFDSVRYLGKPGTPALYAELVDLEQRLRSAAPAQPELAGAVR